MGSWKQLSPSQYHALGLGVAFGITDVGVARESNQDNFFIAPDLGLVAVADGMGGHEAGEIASADAIRLLCGFIGSSGHENDPDNDATVPLFRASAFNPATTDPDATWTDATMKAMITLHDAVEFANERMYLTNVSRDQGEGGGMGTTLTGMWQPAPDGPVFIFHVGDSRLYCWRDGALTQLTHDQTLYQQAVDLGIQNGLPAKNLLLQAMGPTSSVKPELATRAVAPGDLYLLCSDGLHGNSEPESIAAILRTANADNLHDCCAQLIEMAKRDGSRDNITAVLVRCGE